MTPTIIGPSSPSGMPSLTSFAILKTIAPAVTGMAMRKLIRAAESRVKVRKRLAVMVMPEREVPGLRASTCAAPTIRASFAREALDRPDALRALVGEAQEEAEHDERDGDERDRAQLLVDACHRTAPPIRNAGTEREDEQPGQAALPRRRLVALEDHAQAVPGVDDEVAPEVGDDRDERPDVQRHVEGLLDALAAAAGEVVPVEQPGDQQQVARRRDGQELRQALHDPEDDGVEDGHRALARGVGYRRWAGSAAR